MCFCCCESRKSILIYLLITTIIAFIYGIVCLSQFAYKTDIYIYLIARINYLDVRDTSNNINRRTATNYPSNYNDYYSEILDSESISFINSLNSQYVQEHNHKNIERCEGIEKGLGVTLFVFSLIFLCVIIVYLVFSTCVYKETQVLPTTLFNIFYYVKLGYEILAIIFIFLGILYSILIVVVLVEYINFMDNFDSCAGKMVIQMIYGYYCFWFYIVLSCGLAKERQLFIDVGEENKIGPKAEYDLNGNVIAKPVVILAQTPQTGTLVQSGVPQTGVNPQPGVNPQTGVNPQIVVNPQTGTIPQNNGQYQMYQQYNQVPIYNQQQIQGTMPNQIQVQTEPQNNQTEMNLNNKKQIEQTENNKLNKQ